MRGRRLTARPLFFAGHSVAVPGKDAFFHKRVRMILPRTTAIWLLHPQAVDNAAPARAPGSSGRMLPAGTLMTPVMPWILQYCMHACSRHCGAQLQ
jgi:hypothetical protein